MRLRALLTAVILLLLVAFAVINWPVLIQPVPVNLLVSTEQVRLGLALLAVTLGVVLLYFVMLAVTEARMRRERELHAVETTRLRRLTDESEASRYTELRRYLSAEIANLHGKLDRMLANERNDGAIRTETAVPSDFRAVDVPPSAPAATTSDSPTSATTSDTESRWSMRRMFGGS